MTISRFDPAPRGLLRAFLDVRQNWYPGEIHSLTGYDQAEYEALKLRSAELNAEEVHAMLGQAANTLLGLPTTSEQACVECIGSDWRQQLRAFLDAGR